MLLAARRRKERSDSGEYSDASHENPTNNSDNDGDGDSEYGSAEHSGSDLSERESGDGQECEKRVDDDEDRRNPQYIPKRGTFYEHDDRTASGGDNETSGGPPADGTTPNDVSRSDRSSIGTSEGGVVSTGDSVGGFPAVAGDKKRPSRASADKWTHDKFNENDQAPKSSEELMTVYGYDIRGEEGPPRAFRRRKYGRGPNKYTRNWEDEEAYGRGVPGVGGVGPRTPRGPPTVTNGEEFPALQSKNERNNRMDRRRSNGNDNTPNRRPKEDDNDEPKEASPTKQIFPDKAAFSPKPKPEKFATERPEGDKDNLGRKPKAPGRMEPRRTINVRNQAPLQEQNKREVTTSSSISPQRSLPVANAKQPTASIASAFPALPQQDKKILPPRKANQSQVPPRMQNNPPASNAAPSTPSVSAAATVTVSAGVGPASSPAAPAEVGARGKRYSSLRQRPMPDAYQPQVQPQQQVYMNDYQQQPSAGPIQQQPIQQQQQSAMPNLANVPLRQTPPPLVAQQQQPPLPQAQQQSIQQNQQQQQQQNIQQTQQQNIHQQMQQAQQLQQQLQMQQQLHQQQQAALPAAAVLQHQQTQNVNLLHQQGVGPAQLHQGSGLPRQQAKGGLPLRQVSRPLQQPLPLHSMPATAHMQGGLVATQSYAQPPMMPPGQYIQSSNGAVYGQVYAQQPYPALPPQAMPPPQALPQTMPPQAMPQQMPQQIPQQMPQQIPQQMPQQIPQQMPQQISQQMPQQISQQMPQQIPQQIPQQMAQQIPQQMAQQIPQQLTQQLPQQLSQQLPQQIPQQLAQQMPQQIAQQMPQMPPQVMPQQAIPLAPQAMSSQAMTSQSMPLQALPPQAMQGQGYHHQPPAPHQAPPAHQAPYPTHTGRTAFREPSGITYYSPQEQKGAPPPLKRPTSAIPIVPPPSRGRGRIQDNAAAQKDNIDHIVDNMFVPRHQSRTGPSRPGDTPPRTIGVDPQVAKHYEEPLRQPYDERTLKESTPPSKESSPSLAKESSPPLAKDSSPPLATETTPPTVNESISETIKENTPPMRENEPPKETVPNLISESIPPIVQDSTPSLAKPSTIEDRIETPAVSDQSNDSQIPTSDEVIQSIESHVAEKPLPTTGDSSLTSEEMDLEVKETFSKEVEDKLIVENNSSLSEIETEPVVEIAPITVEVSAEIPVQENKEELQKSVDDCDPPLEDAEPISEEIYKEVLPADIITPVVEAVDPKEIILEVVEIKEALKDVEEKVTETGVEENSCPSTEDIVSNVAETIHVAECDVPIVTETEKDSEAEAVKDVPEAKSLAEELMMSDSSEKIVETKSDVESKEIVNAKSESPEQLKEEDATKAAVN